MASMLENVARHVIVLRDEGTGIVRFEPPTTFHFSVLIECLRFLETCESELIRR